MKALWIVDALKDSIEEARDFFKNVFLHQSNKRERIQLKMGLSPFRLLRFSLYEKLE